MTIVYPTSLGAVAGNYATLSTNTFTGDQILSSSAMGVVLPIGLSSSISAGNILYVTGTSGVAQLADQDGTGTRDVVGIALETAVSSSTTLKTATALGSITSMIFLSGATPTSTSQIGQPVYLSATAGEATMTLPVSGTVYKLGILLSSTDEGSRRYKTLYMPSKIVDL